MKQGKEGVKQGKEGVKQGKEGVKQGKEGVKQGFPHQKIGPHNNTNYLSFYSYAQKYKQITICAC